MRKTDVIEFFGSATAAADALGVTLSAVSQWKEIIPRGAAYTALAVSGGALQVDPSLYPRKRFGPRKRKSSKRDRLTA